MVTTGSDWSAPTDFHVAVDTDANPPTVVVWGEVDLATVAPFRDALFEAVGNGARELVVDLTNVTFMGSTGIRELLRVHREVDRLVLRSPTGIVRRALQTATLPETFVIE